MKMPAIIINDDNILSRKGILHSDFIEYLEKCPVCGYKNRTVIAPLNKQFQYLECNNCNAVSASHYLDDSALSKLYSSFYSYDLPCGSDKGITHDSVVKFANHICRYLKITNKNISILDYGGGSGELSYQIALILLNNINIKTVDILIVDPSMEETAICTDSRISINKVTPNIFFEEKKTFDLIIASAVLEHIFFTGSIMKKLFCCLKASGYFYSRAPFLIPLYKFLLKFGIRIETGFPFHLHDFSNSFYEKIPHILNYEDLEIIISQPSFFEYSFSKHFLRAIASRVIRFPYYFNKKYLFVGGWEIIYKRKS